MSGYADITVPAGYVAGLPIGITFIGGRWAEPELLGLAFDYEQATKVRVPPQFIPTIGDALFPGSPEPGGSALAQPQAAKVQHGRVVGLRWEAAELGQWPGPHPFGHRNASRLGGQYVSFAGPMRLLRGTVPTSASRRSGCDCRRGRSSGRAGLATWQSHFPQRRIDVRLGETLAVDEDDASARGDHFAGKSDQPLDERRASLARSTAVRLGGCIGNDDVPALGSPSRYARRSAITRSPKRP